MKHPFKSSSLRDMLVSVGPLALVLVVILIFAAKHLDPAPPSQLTISTGDDQSEFQDDAERYRDILKEDGVTLKIRPSAGPFENLKRLEDDDASVDAAFVQDGLGSTDAEPDVVSLGSLYYEPIWVFYRGSKTLNHISELEGKKIAAGRLGQGTHVITQRLCRLAGMDLTRTQLLELDSPHSAEALKKGTVDAAVFMMAADDDLIHELIADPNLHLMNILQSEAISRQDAAFHHLVLPRGSLDLKADLPHDDVNLIASTATLLVRDDLHPALAYLLLKAASQIHRAPGVFEKRGEFPTNKDDQFPLSDDALQYYKSGGSFWQRYLPYWLAAWFDRFILLVIPVLAVLVPMARTIPKIYEWRIRRRIYQRYGELKFLEMQVKPGSTPAERNGISKKLDEIEARVGAMKVPHKFAEYIYSLRGHIQFVRDRLGGKSVE